MGNAFFVVVVVALVVVPLTWFALRTTCPNCGKWVRRDATRCSYCGSKIEPKPLF
jgi:hypothetical protein